MPSIALLAAGLALAASPPRLHPDVGTAASPPQIPMGAGTTASPPPIPLGASTLPLTAALEVRTASRATIAPLALAPARDGSVAAHGETDEWEAWVVLSPAPGGARAISARVLWRTGAQVEQIALALSWPGAPSAVDRTLRFAPVQGPLRVERGTPLLVQAGAAVLAGGPGLAAARIERAGAGVRATLYLDDAAARPLSTFQTCYERLPTPEDGRPLAWGSFDPRREHRLAPRSPGQEDRLEAQLFPLREGAPFLPVVVERWPWGARAAVVFTDHADRTDPEALRAVLWGDSDPRAARDRGFLGRGLALTRTFFVHGRWSLDEPAMAALADDLARGGSEVALHSITSERDPREAVRRGLADAGRWAPVTWIDHEPYTNCEAISAQGWQASEPFGIRDVLAEGGIRWVWAAGDEGPGLPRIDNLLGGRPDEVRAAIAPFPYDPRLWSFRSSMFYASPAALAAALADAELARLEEARGLFVAHTYFGPSARTTHSAEHLTRLVVRLASARNEVIDPALDAALARVAERVRQRRLASLTWAVAGDRLRGLGEIQLTYLPDGGLEVANHGPLALDGLTLAVPVPPGIDLRLEGGAPLHREDVPGGARVSFDLPARGRAVLRATDHFETLPFLSFP